VAIIQKIKIPKINIVGTPIAKTVVKNVEEFSPIMKRVVPIILSWLVLKAIFIAKPILGSSWFDQWSPNKDVSNLNYNWFNFVENENNLEFNLFSF